jgi:hypothetical protein
VAEHLAAACWQLPQLLHANHCQGDVHWESHQHVMLIPAAAPASVSAACVQACTHAWGHVLLWWHHGEALLCVGEGGPAFEDAKIIDAAWGQQLLLLLLPGMHVEWVTAGGGGVLQQPDFVALQARACAPVHD